MAEFMVYSKSLKNEAKSQKQFFRQVEQYSSEINHIAGSLALHTTAGSEVKNTLKSIAKKNKTYSKKGVKLSQALGNIANLYSSTDKYIATGSTKYIEDNSGISTETTVEYKTNIDSKNSDINMSTKKKAYFYNKSITEKKGNHTKTSTVIVGGAAVSGGMGLSLYKNGKLSPSLKINGSMKLEGLTISEKGSIGDDKLNAHYEVKQTVGYAKVDAEVNAGVITYKDEKTNEIKTEVGVSGKAGAEAYLVQDSISGGLTIFGIKIDVTGTAKAGGAGVTAEGRATTSGVKGKIGLGLGLGGGLEVNVDWSNFKF